MPIVQSFRSHVTLGPKLLVEKLLVTAKAVVFGAQVCGGRNSLHQCIGLGHSTALELFSVSSNVQFELAGGDGFTVDLLCDQTLVTHSLDIDLQKLQKVVFDVGQVAGELFLGHLCAWMRQQEAANFGKSLVDVFSCPAIVHFCFHCSFKNARHFGKALGNIFVIFEVLPISYHKVQRLERWSSLARNVSRLVLDKAVMTKIRRPVLWHIIFTFRKRGAVGSL
mmetsp:Transcript_24422/g.34473  ORF Transcript_24422/g.34473 Transcript_24422/m.34473 type:complete len:223 (-) Transcript_24422:745-1413(-)